MYWELLLSAWRSQGRDGLTIPYIIGSQKFLPTSHKYQNIEELINSIIEGNKEVYLAYCPTIKNLILGLRDNNKKDILGSFPLINGRKQKKFFLTKFVDNLGADISTIVTTLVEKYQENIEMEKFSFNNLEYGDFTGEEIIFIKQTYSIFY